MKFKKMRPGQRVVLSRDMGLIGVVLQVGSGFAVRYDDSRDADDVYGYKPEDAEYFELEADAPKASAEPQEPDGRPMSWRQAHPSTPGAKAVRLRRARTAVEHAVHSIDYMRTAEGGAVLTEVYRDLYVKLATAARELIEAQDEWDKHLKAKEAQR